MNLGVDEDFQMNYVIVCENQLHDSDDFAIRGQFLQVILLSANINICVRRLQPQAHFKI